MTFDWDQHPEAEEELAEAAEWYERRERGVDVIYVIRNQVAIVVAYAHERRRPGYWKHRLNG